MSMLVAPVQIDKNGGFRRGDTVSPPPRMARSHPRRDEKMGRSETSDRPTI
ncbi:hypothetical protein [Lyngbya sp. CCY1209]|uniref:hypothetical protein n=1 Tax=Lyngbya sp. CCY1209 TaxID=2886103 RepID=UPI002D2067F5|nr:hypothetical protein [Lyngbya sp. CCY1209]MEB3882563.1 hypothetical protein [Lyngbya sp. CCY1209]